MASNAKETLDVMITVPECPTRWYMGRLLCAACDSE